VTRIVLDVSVAATWFLLDERPDPAVRDRARIEGATVPIVWQWEIANALLMAERRGRLTAAASAEALADLSTMPIEIDHESFARAWDATYELAIAHRLTLYDAAYLELAQRRALPLASLDGELRAGATAAGIALLP
jgi:predicted nucleic acid-binding protein